MKKANSENMSFVHRELLPHSPTIVSYLFSIILWPHPQGSTHHAKKVIKSVMDVSHRYPYWHCRLLLQKAVSWCATEFWMLCLNRKCISNHILVQFLNQLMLGFLPAYLMLSSSSLFLPPLLFPSLLPGHSRL